MAAQVCPSCSCTIESEAYEKGGVVYCCEPCACDDPSQVTRTAMIIRAYGHCTPETMAATPWKEFLTSL